MEIVNMFGVVLWSDLKEQKAVIWCEDQGDLAFYDGEFETQQLGTSRFFDPGDMVTFEVRHDQKLRKAINPEIVEQQVCSQLPEALRKGALQPETDNKVVPFVGRKSQPRTKVASTKLA